MTVDPTSVPLNWIRPSQAYFIGCVLQKDRDESPKLQALFEGLNELAIEIDHKVLSDNAPWQDEALLDLVSGFDRPQLVVITHDLSVCAAGVASMGMEQGYDVYVVYSDTDTATYADFFRFNSIGAKIVCSGRFIDECRFALDR